MDPVEEIFEHTPPGIVADALQSILMQRWTTAFPTTANDDMGGTFCQRSSTLSRFPTATAFHVLRLPSTSLMEILARMVKYMKCSPECFVMALVLMERYHHRRRVAVGPFNAHRLSLAAVGLATKIHDDIFQTNAYYASVGCVPLATYNDIEAALLVDLRWDVLVEAAEFHTMMTVLQSHTQLRLSPRHLLTLCDTHQNSSVGPSTVGSPTIASGNGSAVDDLLKF